MAKRLEFVNTLLHGFYKHIEIQCRIVIFGTSDIIVQGLQLIENSIKWFSVLLALVEVLKQYVDAFENTCFSLPRVTCTHHLPELLILIVLLTSRFKNIYDTWVISRKNLLIVALLGHVNKIAKVGFCFLDLVFHPVKHTVDGVRI